MPVSPASKRAPATGQPSKRLHFWHCVQNHEWLCSPKGAGFLYARREMGHLLAPLVVSWGWEPENTTLLSLPGAEASPFILQQEWQGTRDIAAYLSVPAAIRFQAAHDWDRVRQACHELVRYARQAIGELTGLEQICPDVDLRGLPDLGGLHTWYAQMATIPLPPCDAGVLKQRLYDEYRVEVPIIEWGGRQFVRVSIQGYNTVEDVEALIAALGAVLPW